MNKTTYLFLLILTLILTACSGISNTAGPASNTQTGPAAGELSASMQVAIGTIKLDETSNRITAEQAAELLPLWETLQDLYSSDTSANQEIEALIAQIQDTMTADQTKAITAMNLTRQDMLSIMQSQGLSSGAQNGNSSNNNSGGSGPGGGFQGPPPDGSGFPGGNPNFQGQGSRTESTDSTNNSDTRTAVNPNRIPTPLIQGVIDYLKKKAGS
jgi:hypothetical protein